MADFTTADRARAAEIVAQLLTADDADALQTSSVTAAALPDPKTLFCQHWGTARQVLQALKLLLPKLGWLFDLIIVAGDKLRAAICPD